MLPSSGTVRVVSESLRLTIVFGPWGSAPTAGAGPGEDDWVVASISEVPGAHNQGRTRDEARTNLIDAPRGILELRFGEHMSTEPAVDSESLELVIAA